jgi:acyl carrier protein
VLPPPGRDGPVETDPPPSGRLAAELAALPAGQRHGHTVEAVIEMACAVLGEVDDIEPDQGFFDLGMDSVLSVRLKSDVERMLGRELPGTVMFECPNATSFADFILSEVLDLGTDPDSSDAAPDEQALADRLLSSIITAESMLTEGDR